MRKQKNLQKQEIRKQEKYTKKKKKNPGFRRF